MSPQRAAVLAVLQKASAPMRLTDIAAAAQMKRNNVAMLLLRMREDGQAEQHPINGLWHVRATAHTAQNGAFSI